MGVKHLLTFCKDSAIDIPLTSLMGQSLAVDGFQKIYQGIISYRKSGSDIYNNRGKPITHIYATLKSVSSFLSLAVLPVYVFDGRTPTIKKSCIKVRKERKKQAEEKCFEIENKLSEEYIKNFKRTFSMSPDKIDEIKELLTYCGIPFVMSPEEADPLLAVLSHQKDIYSVVSDDSDIVVFGSYSMLRDFSPNNPTMKEYNHEQILTYLNNKKNKIMKDYFGESKAYKLSDFCHENLVDIAILFGSEYCPKNIKGISYEDLFTIYVLNYMDIKLTINRIYDYVDKKTIYVDSNEMSHVILNKCKNVDIPKEFVESWENCKKTYMNAKVIHPSKLNYKFNKPDRTNIMKLLCNEHNFDSIEISKFISQLEDLYTLWANNNKRDNKFYSNIRMYQKNYITMRKHKYNFIQNNYGNKLIECES